MTKDKVKKTIISELLRNGIKAEQVSNDSLLVERGHKTFRFYFYELSFSIMAGYREKEFDWTGLSNLSFFYEDTERIWADSEILFVRPSCKSFCAFHMEAE